jgi:hypothetical protein
MAHRFSFRFWYRVPLLLLWIQMLTICQRPEKIVPLSVPLGDGEYVCAGSARQHALYIWEKAVGNLVKILHGKSLKYSYIILI